MITRQSYQYLENWTNYGVLRSTHIPMKTAQQLVLRKVFITHLCLAFLLGLTWSARFKKILCAMPKERFLFYYHRMVVRRNAYTSKRHRESRSPVLPKVRSEFSTWLIWITCNNSHNKRNVKKLWCHFSRCINHSLMKIWEYWICRSLSSFRTVKANFFGGVIMG